MLSSQLDEEKSLPVAVEQSDISARRWGCAALLLTPVVLPAWFALVCHVLTMAADAWTGLLFSFGF